MKILIVSAGVHPVPPVNGGAVENLIDLYLKDNEKNDIKVLSIYDKKLKKFDNKYKNCIFHFIKPKKIIDLVILYCEKILRRLFGIYIGTPYIRRVCSYIRKEKGEYDFIIVENMPQYGPKIKKVSKDKLVLHLHNDYLNIDSFKNKENYSSFDKILCVSDYISNRVKEIGEESDEKVFTLYNGIDLEKFSHAKVDEAVFEKYKIEKDKFSIIFSGRVCPDKGTEELIDSFTMINNKKMQLIIVGGYTYGTSKDNDYILRLKEKAKHHNIIFTGYVDYDDMNSLYSIANLGVIPSIVDDACPLTAIEMMSSGIPIVCTNSGGLPELINEKCGVIVERKNLQENLEKAIKKLYDNEKMLSDFRKCAVERAKLFSKERYVSEFWDYLEKFNRVRGKL